MKITIKELKLIIKEASDDVSGNDVFDDMVASFLAGSPIVSKMIDNHRVELRVGNGVCLGYVDHGLFGEGTPRKAMNACKRRLQFLKSQHASQTNDPEKSRAIQAKAEFEELKRREKGFK